MRLKTNDIEPAIASVKKALADEPNLSPALTGALETLLLLVSLLLSRLGLDRHNSSTPPSADSNRAKTRHHWRPPRRPGGHPGMGAPRCPRSMRGRAYSTGPPTCKAHAVYLSQDQLLPYERVRETFADQLGMPLSAGTLANFNREAFGRLAAFEQAIKPVVADQALLHVDETGINIDGQRVWLHTAGNARLTHYAAHAKRGQRAMDDTGILPCFIGVLCHDHWKLYCRYTGCQHALCNAHHLRELERAAEQDGQVWAQTMQTTLRDIQAATEAAGGALACALSAGTRRWRNRMLRADGTGVGAAAQRSTQAQQGAKFARASA